MFVRVCPCFSVCLIVLLFLLFFGLSTCSWLLVCCSFLVIMPVFSHLCLLLFVFVWVYLIVCICLCLFCFLFCQRLSMLFHVGLFSIVFQCCYVCSCLSMFFCLSNCPFVFTVLGSVYLFMVVLFTLLFCLSSSSFVHSFICLHFIMLLSSCLFLSKFVFVYLCLSTFVQVCIFCVFSLFIWFCLCLSLLVFMFLYPFIPNLVGVMKLVCLSLCFVFLFCSLIFVCMFSRRRRRTRLFPAFTIYD